MEGIIDEVFSGLSADVTEENAEKLQQLVQSKLGDKVDVMLVNGGQPVYYYIISVE